MRPTPFPGGPRAGYPGVDAPVPSRMDTVAHGPWPARARTRRCIACVAPTPRLLTWSLGWGEGMDPPGHGAHAFDTPDPPPSADGFPHRQPPVPQETSATGCCGDYCWAGGVGVYSWRRGTRNARVATATPSIRSIRSAVVTSVQGHRHGMLMDRQNTSLIARHCAARSVQMRVAKEENAAAALAADEAATALHELRKEMSAQVCASVLCVRVVVSPFHVQHIAWHVVRTGRCAWSLITGIAVKATEGPPPLPHPRRAFWAMVVPMAQTFGPPLTQRGDPETAPPPPPWKAG